MTGGALDLENKLTGEVTLLCITMKDHETAKRDQPFNQIIFQVIDVLMDCNKTYPKSNKYKT